MDDQNNNLFAASAAAWWRYYQFLTHVLTRYDRSNTEYIEAMGQFTQRIREDAGEGSRLMTPEDMAEWKRTIDLGTVLHLDIEAFYIFAKIFLDRVADTFGLVFGVKWKSTGSSYSDLSKRFTAVCRDKELEIRPDNLPELILALWKAVVGYRNASIEHLSDPSSRGTQFAPGRASSIVNMPSPGARGGFSQTEDPHVLFRTLDEYIEAMLTFFEINAKKSPLIVS